MENNYTEKQYYSDSKTSNPPKKITVSSIATGLIKGLFDCIQTIVIALALFIVAYLWILSPHQVAGRSMLPNYENGEILLADKLTPKFSPYKRGEVIIFKYDDNRDFIKRIIGLPGENVKLSGGKVFINDRELNEPYLTKGIETHAENLNFLKEDENILVPKDSYFALGDNREESSDSRQIGFVGPGTVHEIKGRVWLVYWPINKIKIEPGVNY